MRGRGGKLREQLFDLLYALTAGFLAMLAESILI